jgi:hypothetical protein
LRGAPNIVNGIGRLKPSRRRAALLAVVAVIALAIVSVVVSNSETDVPPPDVEFLPGCCEGDGIDGSRLVQIEAALRDGAWREAEWDPLIVVANGERQPDEGVLPPAPERGGLAVSITVSPTAEHAELIEVSGVDTTSERAERLGDKVQYGLGGLATPFVTVDGCPYDLDPAAMPALIDKLRMGGIPLITTRLRVDYGFDADWPKLQRVDDLWLISWRQGPYGAPRLLLAIERSRDAALKSAKACLDRLE